MAQAWNRIAWLRDRIGLAEEKKPSCHECSLARDSISPHRKRPASQEPGLLGPPFSAFGAKGHGAGGHGAEHNHQKERPQVERIDA